MPQYEYCCRMGCGIRIVLTRSLSDRDLPVYCECCSVQGDPSARIAMDRIISNTSFSLKGGGWASEGYTKKGGS